MKDEKRKDPSREPATKTPEPPKARPEPDPAAPKPKYVFKILPADPKNTLDFEDTADK